MHHGKARNSVSPGDGLLVKYPRLPPIVPVDDLTDSKCTTIIVMRGSKTFSGGLGSREIFKFATWGPRHMLCVLTM